MEMCTRKYVDITSIKVASPSQADRVAQEDQRMEDGVWKNTKIKKVPRAKMSSVEEASAHVTKWHVT